MLVIYGVFFFSLNRSSLFIYTDSAPSCSCANSPRSRADTSSCYERGSSHSQTQRDYSLGFLGIVNKTIWRWFNCFPTLACLPIKNVQRIQLTVMMGITTDLEESQKFTTKALHIWEPDHKRRLFYDSMSWPLWISCHQESHLPVSWAKPAESLPLLT